MYNTKRVLNELYEIKVSRTISLKTINYFRKLLNSDNFEIRKTIKKQLDLFVEHENIKSLFLEDAHNRKGKEYLIKTLLTTDKKNFRRNKNIVLNDLILAAFLKYYKDVRFLFIGYALVSNGFYYVYEPIYEMILMNFETTEYYSCFYFHHNGKDYEIDKEHEDILQNEKFSCYDKRLYIGEIIYL